jgi:hypothetical protein
LIRRRLSGHIAKNAGGELMDGTAKRIFPIFAAAAIVFVVAVIEGD